MIMMIMTMIAATSITPTTAPAIIPPGPGGAAAVGGRERMRMEGEGGLCTIKFILLITEQLILS